MSFNSSWKELVFSPPKKLGLWKLTKVIILLWFLAQENNDILEKVKEYGCGRKTSVIQQTNYLNKRCSVSLIGFSWTIGLKCADQRQYLEGRNFGFLNLGFPAWVQFNKLLLNIYSGACSLSLILSSVILPLRASVSSSLKGKW